MLPCFLCNYVHIITYCVFSGLQSEIGPCILELMELLRRDRRMQESISPLSPRKHIKTKMLGELSSTFPKLSFSKIINFDITRDL